MSAIQIHPVNSQASVNPPILDIEFEIQLPGALTRRLFQLESPVRLNVRIVGPENSPVVLTLGGISANRHVCDRVASPEDRTTGWWRDLAGSHQALDTQRFRILSFDFFPDDTLAQADAVRVTPTDQAYLLDFLCDYLRLEKLHALVGASYGGMVGLAFAQLFPDRLERLVVACASHRPHPLGAAWRNVQRKIVQLGLASNQPERALSLARELGMTTYRTAEEFGQRFSDGLEVRDYLESRGRDFLKKMSPERYLCLSESIDLHQVDPALIHVPVTLIAFRQDQLVPVDDVRTLRTQLPQVAAYHEFDSIYGHDAFLKEVDLMSQALYQALNE